MLVLTRKPKESVVIDVDGRRIELQVVATARGKVKLGFAASEDVKINRGELSERHASDTPPPPQAA